MWLLNLVSKKTLEMCFLNSLKPLAFAYITAPAHMHQHFFPCTPASGNLSVRYAVYPFLHLYSSSRECWQPLMKERRGHLKKMLLLITMNFQSYSICLRKVQMQMIKITTKMMPVIVTTTMVMINHWTENWNLGEIQSFDNMIVIMTPRVLYKGACTETKIKQE